MEIPIDYKSKIINDNGKLWLDELQGLIKKYIDKFDLRNIEIVPKLSINFVFYATSIFGDVIIKFCKSLDGARDEINFIKNCNSKYMVRMFYYNYEDRIIILERIKPGDSLSNYGDINYRLRMAKIIFDDIYLSEVSDVCKKYYVSFCNKASNVNIISKLDSDSKLMLDKANIFYKDIENCKLEGCILHRDLHYKNILYDGNNFRVIDPHGVYGYRVFELPQIIRAEFNRSDNKLELKDIILKVSELFNFDFEIVCKVLYIDTVEKLLYFTSAAYDEEYINDCKMTCNKIISYL